MISEDDLEDFVAHRRRQWGDDVRCVEEEVILLRILCNLNSTSELRWEECHCQVLAQCDDFRNYAFVVRVMHRDKYSFLRVVQGKLTSS
mgnify:CR=1 FL=1